MRTQPLLSLLALIFFAPLPAHAQVIEIDDAGQSRTFDQPTVFKSDDATPVRLLAARGPASDSAALLAQAAQIHDLDPGLLAAVAWQESRGSMGAVSIKGASTLLELGSRQK